MQSTQAPPAPARTPWWKRPDGVTALDVLIGLLVAVGALIALLPFVAIGRGALAAIDQGFRGSETLGVTISLVALCLGSIFFLYSVKYYLATLAMLASSLLLSRGNGHANGNGHGTGNGHPQGLMRFLRRGNGNGHRNGNGNGNGNGHFELGYEPFVSIHIATFNEKRVIGRLLEGCAALDYGSYEVIVVDDSTDESAAILQAWQGRPGFKLIHRANRDGFKGGALNVALQHTDPRAEFVIVWDADVVPFPDSIQTYLPHFFYSGGSGGGAQAASAPQPRPEVAAVQSYQWHVLNKSESWLTAAVRAEYAGSYMVERPFQEFLGSLKMIAGTAYMIRAHLLRELGWGRSLTEDWELTLRLYARGYKVVYTPYAESPAECVATFGRLARQRMRWAEGHSYNVRRRFGEIMGSPNIGLAEKVEFLYYSAYYLQAALFIVGTAAWLFAELVLHAHVPEWTAVLGWSLLLSNLLALPLMNSAGLLLEGAPFKDFAGVLGALATSFLLVPFQAYAALKGLFERDEGPWYRTPKTGRVTDPVRHLRRLKWLRRWLGPAERNVLGAPVHAVATPQARPPRRLGWIVVGALVVALGALLLSSAHVPISKAVGSALYLHGTGAAPGCTPSTMDPTGGTRTLPACGTSPGGSTSIFSFANPGAAQTVGTGLWTFTMDWTDTSSGNTDDTATLTVGTSTGPTCAGFTPLFSWSAAYGRNSTDPVSPLVTSASDPSTITIPAGGALCLQVVLSHHTGPPSATVMHYDGPAGADTNLTPPTTVVPEALLPFIGLALAIPLITVRRRLPAWLALRAWITRGGAGR